mmetsp:Transcript_45326/g.67330  ORF Transcript_45326/g.67330 Transcript_45326/m.67330 type:complete len:170 (-) Transcript_45326:91-600(-)
MIPFTRCYEADGGDDTRVEDRMETEWRWKAGSLQPIQSPSSVPLNCNHHLENIGEPTKDGTTVSERLDMVTVEPWVGRGQSGVPTSIVCINNSIILLAGTNQQYKTQPTFASYSRPFLDIFVSREDDGRRASSTCRSRQPATKEPAAKSRSSDWDLKRSEQNRTGSLTV